MLKLSLSGHFTRSAWCKEKAEMSSFFVLRKMSVWKKQFIYMHLISMLNFYSRFPTWQLLPVSDYLQPWNLRKQWMKGNGNCWRLRNQLLHMYLHEIMKKKSTHKVTHTHTHTYTHTYKHPHTGTHKAMTVCRHLWYWSLPSKFKLPKFHHMKQKEASIIGK